MKIYLCSLIRPFSFLRIFSTIFLFIIQVHGLYSQTNAKKQAGFPDDKVFRIAFWNLENFMDTANDEGHDGEFTPGGSKHWNAERLTSKTNNLARAIQQMNPDILGVAEVEHESLLKKLSSHDSLKKKLYGIVHYESDDYRGIDVGLLYNRNKIFVISSTAIKISMEDSSHTRDILYVKLLIKTQRDTLHLFVNHWPSRREGVSQSEHKRIAAANALKRFTDSLGLNHKQTLVMGDFNDNPEDMSLSSVLGVCGVSRADCSLYNLYQELTDKNIGTGTYSHKWGFYDQIIISRSLIAEPGNKLKYRKNSYRVFHPAYMCDMKEGKIISPKRTYSGNEWLNGYSDHFPVTAELWYE